MTKKHFISLANALMGLDVPETVLEALIGWCRSENSNFDEQRWLAYLRGECGPNGGKVKQLVKE